MGVCSATARQTCGTPSWEGPEEADSGRKWSDGGQGPARAWWAVTQSGRLGSARRGRGAAQCSLGRWGGGLRAAPRRLWGPPCRGGPGRQAAAGTRGDWTGLRALPCLACGQLGCVCGRRQHLRGLQAEPLRVPWTLPRTGPWPPEAGTLPLHGRRCCAGLRRTDPQPGGPAVQRARPGSGSLRGGQAVWGLSLEGTENPRDGRVDQPLLLVPLGCLLL